MLKYKSVLHSLLVASWLPVILAQGRGYYTPIWRSGTGFNNPPRPGNRRKLDVCSCDEVANLDTDPCTELFLDEEGGVSIGWDCGDLQYYNTEADCQCLGCDECTGGDPGDGQVLDKTTRRGSPGGNPDKLLDGGARKLLRKVFNNKPDPKVSHTTQSHL